MATEPKIILLNVVLMVLTFVFPRARVLTLPFFFVAILTSLFWSARVSAERKEEKKEGES